MSELGSPSPGGGVKSAERTLSLLDHVAEKGQVRFQDVVDSGIPKSSAHALLATLVSSGWLVYSAPTRQYRLGLRAWQLGQAYDGHRRLIEIAHPVMDALVADLGETVQLARLDGIENLYIAIRQSPHPMRMASSVGMRLQSHATGIGKALLSTLTDVEAERRLSEVALPRLTANTQTDVPALMAVIEKVRENGYAIDDEEFIEGCRCVAVPIAGEGEIGLAAAMSITMPTLRTGPDWPGSMIPRLGDARDEIRAEMGLRPMTPTLRG